MSADLERARVRAVLAEANFERIRLEYQALRKEYDKVVQSMTWRTAYSVNQMVNRYAFIKPLAMVVAKRLISDKHKYRVIGAPNLPDLLNTYQERVEEFRRIIRESPFFDAEWYASQNPDVAASGVDPDYHFLFFGGQEGRRPGPLFNTAYYLNRNPDLVSAELNPLVHYITHGAFEGRAAWSNQDVLGWQSEFVADPAQALVLTSRAGEQDSFLDPKRPVALLTSSIGNFFFHDLSRLFALGLREAGYKVTVSDESLEGVERNDQIVVMAPHEFYYLGDGVRLRTSQQLLHSIPINTEQWQTQWFSRALPFCLRAEKMLDINLQSAASFKKLGRNARYLALGYSAESPVYSSLPKDTIERKILQYKYAPKDQLSDKVRPLHERPIDILFVGGLSPRRAQLLAQLSPIFAENVCFLHAPSHAKPLAAHENIDAALFSLLARNSKILLNLHQGAIQYFEWQRIVFGGFWQKTLVLTEKCFGVPHFEAGEHYLACESTELADTLNRALFNIKNRGGAQKIVDGAYNVLTKRYALAKCISWI